MDLERWLGSDNKLGMDIWNNKYKNMDETFEGWLERVSNGNVELAEAIKNKKFIFGGRILSNRGLHKLGKKITYSNCYVVGAPEDSIESIFETAKKLARTFSYGGGCGVDVSKLRPRGAAVNNAAKETSGAVSFMDLYSLTTEIIGQNGRRGALMISLDADHPDVEEFISVKSDLNRITKANISVKVSDKFMESLAYGMDYETEFPIEGSEEGIKSTVQPAKLFKELARQNWDYAEPGILFWDNINKWNLLSEDEDFEYAGVNPCAEETLPAGGSCLLGSLILPSFYDGEKFNFEDLAEHVAVGVRALNEVLDEGLPLHPLAEQRESVADWRQIGLGVLGIGDLLIKMGLKYGDDTSLEFCDKIGALIVDTAIRESALIAKEKGAFPKYKKEAIMASPYFINNTSEETKELVEAYGLRNSQLLTIAPTGSIGTMLQISTGIEPNFAFSYTRKTESLHGEDVFYKVFTPIAREYMEEHGLENEEDLPEYFVTAQNLDPRKRVLMQGVWQRHIDASISSTVNLVNETSVEEVEELYKMAWENGLKGMTVYRAGCSREGILTVEDKKEEVELKRGDFKAIAPDTIYYPEKIQIGCGKIKLMIGYSAKEGCIQDLYVIRSGQGGCEKNLQAVAIYMSGMLRLGGNLFMLEKSIEGISGCTSFSLKRGRGEAVSPGNTCSSAILYALKRFMKEIDSGEPAEEVEHKEVKSVSASVCPECGEEMENSGGCVSCRHCGYSKCS